MKVFILSLVVLALVYYFFWNRFCEWMDARNFSIRLKGLLSRTELCIEETGEKRYKLLDDGLTCDGFVAQTVYANGAWRPVFQVRCTVRSVFGPIELVFQVGDERSYLRLRKYEIVKGDGRYLVTVMGKQVEDISDMILKASACKPVHLMVLGGDFVRTYRIEDGALEGVRGMLELARMLNKQQE